jgi:hypothetical protein
MLLICQLKLAVSVGETRVRLFGSSHPTMSSFNPSGDEDVTQGLALLALNTSIDPPSHRLPLAPSLPPVTPSWSSPSLSVDPDEDLRFRDQLSSLSHMRMRSQLFTNIDFRISICRILHNNWDLYKDTSSAETSSIASSRRSKTKSLKATPQKDKKGGGTGPRASSDRFFLWLSSALITYCVMSGADNDTVQTCHILAPRCYNNNRRIVRAICC